MAQEKTTSKYGTISHLEYLAENYKMYIGQLSEYKDKKAKEQDGEAIYVLDKKILEVRRVIKSLSEKLFKCLEEFRSQESTNGSVRLKTFADEVDLLVHKGLLE